MYGSQSFSHGEGFAGKGSAGMTMGTGVFAQTQYLFRKQIAEGNEVGLPSFQPQHTETTVSASVEDLAVGWMPIRIQLDAGANFFEVFLRAFYATGPRG